MEINKDGNWKIYWGNMPLPQGAEPIGVITLDIGDRGALILLANGVYVNGGYGAIRNLDQNKVKKELGISIKGGKRAGAGNKPIPNPLPVKSIRCTDDELLKVKELLKELRK